MNNFLEILQLVVAAIGLAFSHWNLWVAVEDAVAMAGAGGLNSPTRLTALRSVSREIMLLMVNGTLALNGVINVLLNGDGHVPVLEHNLGNILLICITVLTALDALFERHSRTVFDDVVHNRKTRWTLWKPRQFTVGTSKNAPTERP